MPPIKTAVIPVAGMGVRALPATKGVAKELFPIGFKPIIQHIVDECMANGINHIVLVTSEAKLSVADYFKPNPDLIEQLRKQGKHDKAQALEAITPKGLKVSTVMQPTPLGLGHAILCAEDAVAGEPFLVILPDVFTHGAPCVQSILENYQQGENVIALESVTPERISSYGIVAVDKDKITGMVEKPSVENAPSNLAILGRYLLQPEIFNHLHTIEKGANNEYQLTDAMISLMHEQIFRPTVYGGTVLDCSTQTGLLEANILTMLGNEKTAKSTQDILNKYIK